MTAETREELLGAYLDDELSADERAQVERWLAESAEYRQLYEELCAVRNDLQSLPRHTLSEDLGPDVLRRAERTVLSGQQRPTTAPGVAPRSTWSQWWSQGRSRRMFIWPALAVAAALLVALFDARREGDRELAREETRDQPASADTEASTRAAGGAEFRRRDSAREADVRKDADKEQPALTTAPPPAPKSGAVRLEKSAATPDFDANTDGRLNKAMARQPIAAEVAPLAAADSAPADQPAQQAVETLKMEIDVRRALANREQVNFIQCDVSPDFVNENQMEKVLSGSKVAYKRLVVPEILDEKNVGAQTQSKLSRQGELRYALECSPEQVEQIVTDLEQERGRRRVSNLIIGLQDQAPSQDKLKAMKPVPAYALDKDSYSTRQQAVTIYLRQMEARQAAEPAEPARPASP